MELTELNKLVANQGTTIHIIEFKTNTTDQTETLRALTISKYFYHRALSKNKRMTMIWIRDRITN